jgi:Proprotein convertase P-domain
MPNGRTPPRGVAAAATLLALVTMAGVVGGSVAHGSAKSTGAASNLEAAAIQADCPAWYVVTATSTDVNIDPEPTGFRELWDIYPRGRVFCALGTNGSRTRFQVDYWCDLIVYCSVMGPHTAWISNSPSAVTPLNCTPYLVSRYAPVYKHADESVSIDRWGNWEAGRIFCTFGKNPRGTRFQVYEWCDTPPCAVGGQTVIGWVPTDPRLYTPLPPAPVYPPAQRRFTNDTDFPVNDNTTIDSPITVTGVPGNAPATLKVEVNITHPYIADLVVTLVAPDGSLYVLHDRAGGDADNIVTTFTVNASSEVANGTWNLRVADRANADTGTLNVWSLVF